MEKMNQILKNLLKAGNFRGARKLIEQEKINYEVIKEICDELKKSTEAEKKTYSIEDSSYITLKERLERFEKEYKKKYEKK